MITDFQNLTRGFFIFFFKFFSEPRFYLGASLISRVLTSFEPDRFSFF